MTPHTDNRSPKKVGFSTDTPKADNTPKRTRFASYPSTYDDVPEVTKDSTTQKALMVTALLFFCATYQTCLTIRYGFLADSFSKRNISGEIYGLMEGSIFFGYLAAFMSHGIEFAMKRVKSKYLLIAVLVCLGVSTIGTGLAYMIEDNYICVAVSITLRVTQGFFNYSASLLAYDFIAAKFPKYFDAFSGAFSTAMCMGHGLSEGVGSVLYDQFGYIPPFFFAGAMCIVSIFLIAIIIPAQPCHLAMQDPSDHANKTTKKTRGVTPLIVLPLIATMLVNVCYGFLQVTATPYLYNIHDKSISFGGLVLMVASVGMGTGALSAGFILHTECILPATQMGLGALTVAIGMFFTFPRESMGILFDLSPVFAFPAAFLTGFGDPIITNSALRCMYQLQLQKRRQLTAKDTTFINGIWLVGYNAFFYGGAIVSGVLCDVLSYADSADILAALCILSVMICEVLRYMSKNNKLQDESIPLIAGH